MTIQIELLDLIKALCGLLIVLVGAFGALGQLLLGQFEKRLAERFRAQAEVREAADNELNAALQRHLDEERKTSAKLGELERDFFKWQADMPLNYVRRDDYIRGQTVIEAKLDALYDKLELVQLMKGSR